MSNLQKSIFKSHPTNPPPMASPNPAGDPPQDDDDTSSEASSTGTAVPSPSRSLFPKPRQLPDSLSWTDFFTQELYIEEDQAQDQDNTHINIIHHVYLTPPKASKDGEETGPLFVMHHGAGSSGLTFAACAGEIRKILPKAGILSVDCRNHGSTTTTTTTTTTTQSQTSGETDNTEEIEVYNPSLENLSRDLVFVLRETQRRLGWESLPDIVLVGHSLGGAVVTDVAKKGDLGSKVLAYAVLDIVEGSALEALQGMERYLSTRPSRFPSLSSGIEWHTRSRTIRNKTSALVSVPPLLQRQSQPTDPANPWVWRTDLSATKPFWENWFIGLSRKFLEGRAGKLLVLAGTDRLDKELMIGQMQGKYQLQVLPEAGHFIQEDQPAKTAQILVDFYKRNDRGALVLPPKVADMQRGVASWSAGIRK